MWWGGRPGGEENFVDSYFVGEKQCFDLAAVETRKRTGSFTTKNCAKLLSAKFTGALVGVVIREKLKGNN